MKQIGEIKSDLRESKSLQTTQNQLEWISAKKKEIILKYGDAKNFAIAFNPSIQAKCSLNIERSLKGEAPTLRQLLHTYQFEHVRVWLMAQMENLNDYAGARDKMTQDQMIMLADIFVSKAMYLKASEILLFFHKFKSGDLGDLYGSVDPMKVATALNEFLSWRSETLTKINAQEQRDYLAKKRENWRKQGITRKQHERNKRVRSWRKVTGSIISKRINQKMVIYGTVQEVQ